MLGQYGAVMGFPGILPYIGQYAELALMAGFDAEGYKSAAPDVLHDDIQVCVELCIRLCLLQARQNYCATYVL